MRDYEQTLRSASICPARIIFRAGHGTDVVAVKGNKIYISPNPKESVGRWESANILGSNLEISGFPTSLERDEGVLICDLTGLRYLESIGYRSFILSGGVCPRGGVFQKAMLALGQYEDRFINIE